MYGKQIGDMAWMDLTVPNAEQVKRFYSKVLGWQSEGVSMSCEGQQYEDFAMSSNSAKSDTDENNNKVDSDAFVTGVCHAKGANADMPALWLPYFLVADIEVAVSTVQAEGGQLVIEIKSMGDDKYAVIQDPSGAKCALYQRNDTK